MLSFSLHIFVIFRSLKSVNIMIGVGETVVDLSNWNSFYLLSFVIKKLNSSLMLWLWYCRENGVWAKPMTSDDMLQANINFACNYVDCSLIRHGGGCYHPDTLINHASVIMNLYYQAFGRENSSCYFKNTGCIVMKDPSKPI